MECLYVSPQCLPQGIFCNVNYILVFSFCYFIIILMKEDERILLREHRESALASDLLAQEALDVARRLFPQDTALSLMSTKYDSKNPNSYAFYSTIVSHIRQYPSEDQNNFFLEVWGPNGIDVPNAELLASYLTRCNTIPWFSPKEEVDVAILQAHISEHLSALNSESLPITLIKNDWSVEVTTEMEQEEIEDGPGTQFFAAFGNVKSRELEGMGSPIWSSIWVTASNPVFEAISKDSEDKFMGKLEGRLMFGGGIEDFKEDEKRSTGLYFAGWTAASHASTGAKYYVYMDEMKKFGFSNNPMESLIDIYKLGYYPMGVLEQEVDGEKKRVFGIFQPPIQS